MGVERVGSLKTEHGNNEKSHTGCTTKLQNKTQMQRHFMPNEIKNIPFPGD